MNGTLLFWLHAPISLLMPACLSAYVVHRALGFMPRSRRAALLRLVLFAVLFLFTSLTLIVWSEQARAPLGWLLEPGYFLLGYLLTAFPLLLGSELLRFVHVKQLARQRVHATALLGALALTVVGTVQARGPARVTHLDVPVAGLPAPLSGYRIVQLSDIHLRGAPDEARLERLVAQANAQGADLIALTGDIVDGPMDNLRRRVRALGKLRAPDGVWLVLGNHEYYADAEACVAEFRRLGITVLLDEHRVIEHGGATLVVAGVTNPQQGLHGSALTEQGRLGRLTAEPRAALAGAPPGVRLLLAHQPKSVRLATDLGVSLALSGHTHGGQFFPWNYVVRWIEPYPTGLFHEGRTWIYTSPGLGTFGPKHRLGSAAEMTLFTLTR